jgi:hypothetical protein
VLADPSTCTFQFDPVGKARFDSPCDKVKTFLVKQGLPYSSEAAPARHAGASQHRWMSADPRLRRRRPCAPP